MVVVFAVSALALATDVIPASDLSKRVPMTTVFYGRSSLRAPVRTADFVVTHDEQFSLLVRGRDKAGKAWQVMLPAATDGLWETDLNGIPTYYFVGYTGGAGMAPPTWILTLSFDERGWPVPFYTTGFAISDEEGISDVLNLDGTGPELVEQNWEESKWTAQERSGYYITTLYQQRGIYWYRADGRHGARSFPLYEKWGIVQGTRPQLVAAPDSARPLADYGNDPRSAIRARVLGLDKEGIHLGSGLPCRPEFIDVVVEDSKAGRQIEVGYFSSSSPGALLPDIARNRLFATFTGLNRWSDGSCLISIVSASKE